MIRCLIRSYQLHSSKATNSQCVDDVEVIQLQTGEEGVLSLVPGGKINTVTPFLNTGIQSVGRWSSGAGPQCFLKMVEMLAIVAYLQHLTTWKKGNFFVVWMEKEEWGAGRLSCSLCCLTTSGNSSLMSGLYFAGPAGFLNTTQNGGQGNVVVLLPLLGPKP